MADYSKLSIPELKKIRDEVDAALAAKVEARKAELMKELQELGVDEAPMSLPIRKAAKPAVKAMYRSKTKPDLVWAGRGQKAKWLVEEMKETGKPLDYFKA